MFGKKKDAEKTVSQAPFPLQVLTIDYFIEGTAMADQRPACSGEYLMAVWTGSAVITLPILPR